MCFGVLLQEKSTASDVYEHIRDGSNDYDTQTMDAATDSQRQMMQMTELDSVNDDDGDDADKPTVPPKVENDIVQVIFIFLTSLRNCVKLHLHAAAFCNVYFFTVTCTLITVDTYFSFSSLQT